MTKKNKTTTKQQQKHNTKN